MDQLLAALRPLVERVRTDVTAVKSNGRQAWTREPLTEAALRRHLGPGPARGVCPIKAGESTVRVALLDLDSHKGEVQWSRMVEVAEALAGALVMRGVVVHPWRSSGGSGMHLIALWDDPQDAYTVRCELREALAEVGLADGPRGVAHGQVEVFPKQDSVPADGFGNQFILPLAGASEPLFPPLGWEGIGRDGAAGYTWDVSAPLTPHERPARSVAIVAPSGDMPRLQSALAAIPNDGEGLDYDSWRDVIFAIHHATGGAGLDVAHAFSARSTKYDPDFLEQRVWPFVRDAGGITEGTIYRLASEAGWREDVAELFEVLEPAEVAASPARRRGVPQAKHLTTDQANANRIVARFGRRLIVVAGQWYAWSGTRWEQDDGEVYRCGCRLSELIHAEAEAWRAKPSASAEEKEKNDGVADALAKWAHKSEMKGAIEAALGLAKKLLAVHESEINRNPWLLNCINGTVDLRTGELQRHSPDDYITKLVPIAYDPSVRSRAWEEIIARITLETGVTTRPLAGFLQRWFGYCATGSTREQCFVVHYGQGSNGKSTILDTVAEVLGDYAATAAPGLLVSSDKDRHPTEVADLFGRRMVTAHESGEGGHLREDMVKQLTGGDKVKARFMRADFFEFDPTHKLQLLTNHKPIIKGSDNGIWRRVLLMPYLARFGTAEEAAAGRAHYVKDTRTAERLRAELQGVLTWVVEGARAWAHDGLQPPDVVLAASRDYQAEQDRIAQFVAECCELDPTAEAPLADPMEGGLYMAYRGWCNEGGWFPLSKQKLLQELERCVPNFAKRSSRPGGKGERRREVLLIRGLRVLDR